MRKSFHENLFLLKNFHIFAVSITTKKLKFLKKTVAIKIKRCINFAKKCKMGASFTLLFAKFTFAVTS